LINFSVIYFGDAYSFKKKNIQHLDLLYGEHLKQNSMIDLDDLNEDDLFNSISETLLEIEELESNNSSGILSS